MELVVIEPFNGYQKGDIITDTNTVNEILESEWSAHVVKKAASPASKGA